MGPLAPGDDAIILMPDGFHVVVVALTSGFIATSSGNCHGSSRRLCATLLDSRPARVYIRWFFSVHKNERHKCWPAHSASSTASQAQKHKKVKQSTAHSAQFQVSQANPEIAENVCSIKLLKVIAIKKNRPIRPLLKSAKGKKTKDSSFHASRAQLHINKITEKTLINIVLELWLWVSLKSL